ARRVCAGRVRRRRSASAHWHRGRHRRAGRAPPPTPPRRFAGWSNPSPRPPRA
ncbi:MAG: hypothetical protein AVDCRST_MAG88-2988, partial [uncultured Thermomicrobiales bacterium]